MDYKEVYEQWIANPYFDEATKEELKSIAEDENEIKERFYMDLEFGTAGLRGIIGAGTNRMNIYVVQKSNTGACKLYHKSRQDNHRVLQLHMIPAICHRNLQRKQLFVLQQTELRRMSLRSLTTYTGAFFRSA